MLDRKGMRTERRVATKGKMKGKETELQLEMETIGTVVLKRKVVTVKRNSNKDSVAPRPKGSQGSSVPSTRLARRTSVNGEGRASLPLLELLAIVLRLHSDNA